MTSWTLVTEKMSQIFSILGPPPQSKVLATPVLNYEKCKNENSGPSKSYTFDIWPVTSKRLPTPILEQAVTRSVLFIHNHFRK